MNEVHVTCRTLYLFVLSRISLNLHTSHFPRLIIRCGSVRFLPSLYNEGARSAFSAVFRLPYERLTQNKHSQFPTNTLQTVYVWLKSISNESQFTGENPVPLRPYLGFQWRDFRQTSHLALSTYALHMVYIWLQSVNDEGTLLREQSSFSSVPGLQ